MDKVMDLLDEMEAYLNECKNVMFSNKISVDPQIIYEFMSDIRMHLPDEIKHSQKIVEESNKILDEATNQAKDIESEAIEHARKMIDKTEIKKRAIEEAEQILSEARNVSEQIKDGAYDYAKDMLDQNEKVLTEVTVRLEEQYSQYDAYLRQQIEVLKNNKESLQ